MSDCHDFYRLDRQPIARGGQAEVIRVENRETGEVVALKRRVGAGKAAADRMRREIQVQSQMQHPNVMPILDFDQDKYEWFTMPLAETTLAAQPAPLPTDDIKRVLLEAATGLQAAHRSGFIHRDLKPSNILYLDDDQGARWVVADWGIVRRPVGETTAQHTLKGTFLGTEGFAPPEAYVDAHDADFTWDAYSLGRVAAWAATGKYPAPLIETVAPEPWRRFVRVLTAVDPTKRPMDMERVLELLSRVAVDVADVPGIPPDLLKRAKEGDADATLTVLAAALDYPDDGDFFIDDVVELIGPGLDVFVQNDAAAAGRLLDLMSTHLEHIAWGHRNFDQYNDVLHWMQRVAQGAADAGELDLLEDAAQVLFKHEPPLDRWRQAARSRRWIASLRGEPAERVAVILREQPDAARYYGELKDADARIRAALKSAGAAHK